ncbi:hypothetical protein HQK17_28105 [Bacillus cereus]|uniref:hypothetical protein n=1 Tax=Bacillus cereus TaxID=1396 RepID=UPI00156B051E|nr:hypothetical protein [Bacillus cereus]NRQ71986.1 hypothetical protein [Bacillus cereus]
MLVSVTLGLTSGLEIEYDKTIDTNTIDLARDYIQLELEVKEDWLKLDNDAAVRRSEVVYFKVAELKEEEEDLEGKAITSI